MHQTVNNKNSSQAFTLIELMIVIAVIGILAAIAIPAYQDYTTRSKISEIIQISSASKSTLYDEFLQLGVMPTQAETSVNMDASRFERIQNITFNRDGNNAVSLNYELDNIDQQVNGETVTMTFTAYPGTATGIGVTCAISNSATNNKFLPASCR